MRILIDLQGAQNESRLRGIGRYSKAITKAIIRNQGDHEIFILLNGLFEDTINPIKDEFTSILSEDHIGVFYFPSPVEALVAENTWRMEAAELIREWVIGQIAPDALLITSLFEGTADNSITSVHRLETFTKTAVILYDLIPLQNPNGYLTIPETRKWYYSKIDSLRRADLLLAISDSARREAVDMLCFDASRIVAIHSAADERFTAANISLKESKVFLERMGIWRKFIMYTSAFESRKNFEGLIRAFSLLPGPLRESYQLVLVTAPDPDSQNALRRVADEAGLRRDELVLLGYVSDRELVTLYSLCTLFVFPSFHEGFGLPALEAMCCGAAVIGSNTTSIPEVIGREDALFDPHSAQSVAELMQRALTDEVFHASLKAHAFVQSRRFSWDRTAKSALRAIEEMAVSDHPRPHKEDTSILLDKIATLESDVSPNRQDLIAVSQCIAINEKVTRDLNSARSWRKHSAKFAVARRRPGHIEAHEEIRAQPLAMSSASEAARVALEADLRFSIIGHINGSYSLAAVNRRMALALEAARPGTVCIEQVEGQPLQDLSLVPPTERATIALLAARGPHEGGQTIEIAQHWPVWVSPHSADLKLASVAWEESLVPIAMVRLLNEKFQGILVWTHFIAKALIDSGVRLPVRVMGYAPDLGSMIAIGEKRATAAAIRQPNKAKPFTFLHVSSCFPRKGVDALLAAYSKAFRRSDPVRLVIKGFPNPHNDVPEQIACLRNRDPETPEIMMINRDIPAKELAALYATADATVLPTRGEGFNIPAAEALAAGVPLIITGYSGQIDFAGPDVARHVDFRFAPSGSHLHSPDSVWADPDIDDLAAAMRETFNASCDPVAGRDIVERVERGRRVAAALDDGAAWALRVRKIAVDLLLRDPEIKPAAPRIAWVTTWNIHCGIANYSRYLLDRYPDAARDVIVLCDERTPPESLNVLGQPEARVAWRLKDPIIDDHLAREIAAIDADAVVIQHQPGLIYPESLMRLLRDDRLSGREILLTLHNLHDLLDWENWDLLCDAFRGVSRILVQNLQDLNLLKIWGLVDNVSLFPHGSLRPTVEPRPARDLPETAALIIGTYGFFLPNKGFDILIEAVAEVRNEWPRTTLRMVTSEYPNEESQAEIARCRDLAQSLGLQDAIEWHTDYLSDAESLVLLSQCDLLALPRRRDRPESTSGAVRVAMASRVPVLVTPVEIFDELGDAVLRTEGMGPRPLAAAIAATLRDRHMRQETADKADRWLEAHDWERMSERLYGMICGLVTNRHSFARAASAAKTRDPAMPSRLDGIPWNDAVADTA